MIYTYRNFLSTFLQMNTWWDIYTLTLYQFSCRGTRDNIYMPQLYINFPTDEHLMIYTYRNFISSFLQMNTWWYMHAATLYQFFSRWTPDDIDIPQLYINFPADEHLMIYTYQNFISIFAADEQVIRYTYRNFISSFLQMNTWWYIHTANLYQLCRRWTPDDIYIPKLYINFPAVVQVMIYTYRNLADKHVMIYTYRNFISTFLQMNTWWYVHTATFYQFSSRWTRDDIYIPQLYINFPAVEQGMIYTYHNFISIFQQMNTWSYIHTATLYQLFFR